MAASTGPILAAAGISYGTAVLFNGRNPVESIRIPLMGAVAAGCLYLIERVNAGLAVGLAWLTLGTVLLVRVDPKVPTPIETFANWVK